MFRRFCSKCAATAAAFVIMISVNSACAVVVPFVEDFSSSASNWFDATAAAPVTWNAAGGPDGGSYVSTTFNFVNSTPVDTPALFRGQDRFNSSQSAFVGDWVAAGVTEVHGFVRHDSTGPMTFFVRYASPNNFPGAVSLVMPDVPSGQWTPFAIPIPDPNFIFEGPFTYGQVFSNIGHLQIGVAVPASLAGVDQTFAFDLDKLGITNVSAVPALSWWGVIVTGLGLLVGGAMIAGGRRPASSASIGILAKSRRGRLGRA